MNHRKRPNCRSETGDEAVIDVAMATISVLLCLLLSAMVLSLTAISTHVHNLVTAVARNEARAIESSNLYLPSPTLQQIAVETLGHTTSITIATQSTPIEGSCPSESFSINLQSQQLPFIGSAITESVPIGLNFGGCR
ncbi:MAG: hypothetical protein M0019_01410 [Actinomycetota bacterium]|nr:hypothetical protein [Actinomycetota bacterium]